MFGVWGAGVRDPRGSGSVNPFGFSVDALAAYRLTRLVIKDTIADRPRDFVYEWASEGTCDAELAQERDRGSRVLRCLRPAGHRSELHETTVRWLGETDDEVVRWTDDDEGASPASPAKWVHPKIAELLGCPWCAGFWISIGVVAARRVVPRAWDPVARVLATSAIAGIIGSEE